MQYRIRVVAGFGTQGYLIGSILKNEMMPVGVYDEYKETPLVTRNDFSYRELMAHGYVMADTSMFRHMELTVPYDYPTPFYDQYDWIYHRVAPDTASGGPTPVFQWTEFGAPHGDNFIVVGIRGSIDAPNTTTMQFELEYRAVEGFQFAEPGLPPSDFLLSRAAFVKDSEAPLLIKTIPDSKLKSDGIGVISKKGAGVVSPPVRSLESDSHSSTSTAHVYENQSLVHSLASSSSSAAAITYPHGPPLGPYKSVNIDKRGGKYYTHCRRENGSWISWLGDVRAYISAASSEDELWKNTRLQYISPDELRLLARKAREAEFT